MIPLEEIYQVHQHLVFNLCLDYLQNREDAEEATQDVFVKIHQKIATFEGKSALKTWIYRITIFHCLDILRARKRPKRFRNFLTIFRKEGEKDPDLPHFDHPGVLLENRESLEILFQKIHSLPENQKTALILRYLDDRSPPEIAEIMQVSTKAVESLLHRAKQQLEKKLRHPEG